MTITLGWIRKNKNTQELIVASDSRLRSRGAMDQCQKLYHLARGDCCLAFCGDTHVVYPLFIQFGSAIDNFIKFKTRATDVTDLVNSVRLILNNLVASWDIDDADKKAELDETKVLFAGWSWRFSKFKLGVFEFKSGSFEYSRARTKLPYPWKENSKSLIVIGDYKDVFLNNLSSALGVKYGPITGQEPKKIDFDYEPISALSKLLLQSKKTDKMMLIGGAPQMLKVYPHANTLPIVIRFEEEEHYLFGRKLFDWEKTQYPILSLTSDEPIFHYPMASIPLPKSVSSIAPD